MVSGGNRSYQGGIGSPLYTRHIVKVKTKGQVKSISHESVLKHINFDLLLLNVIQ